VEEIHNSKRVAAYEESMQGLGDGNEIEWFTLFEMFYFF
jgi:hypothetical protein